VLSYSDHNQTDWYTNGVKQIARGVHEGNKLKEKELQIKERDVELKNLFRDTTRMTDDQIQDHKMLCKIIREKYGLV
jgi:hypothetical protein